MCTYRKVTLLVPSLCEPRRRVATGSSRTLVRPRCDFAAILVECVGTDFTRKRGLCDACQQWHGFDVDGRKRACVVKKRKEKQKKHKRRDTIILLIHLHQDFQKQLCIFEKKKELTDTERKEASPLLLFNKRREQRNVPIAGIDALARPMTCCVTAVTEPSELILVECNTGVQSGKAVKDKRGKGERGCMFHLFTI